MHFTACERCFKDIYLISPVAAYLWLSLVDEHIDEHYLFYVIDPTHTDTLEREGYILTHETDERILFVLKGKRTDYFCIDPENHDQQNCCL